MSYTAIVINYKVQYMEHCSTPKGMDIPAWSLHRLLSLYNLHYIEFMNDEEIESVYDIVIDAIEQAIKEGYFNKEYLV